jgi:hypothetical protein
MSQLTIQPSLIIDNQTYAVTSIFVDNVRYTNCKQYAAFLQIQQDEKSRHTYEIKTVKLVDILAYPPLGGGMPNLDDFQKNLCETLEIPDTGSLGRSIWLKDREVVKWTLKAKTTFAKEFTDHVVDVFMEKANSLGTPFYRLPGEDQDEYDVRIGEAFIAAKKGKIEANKKAKAFEIEAANNFKALNESNAKVEVLETKIDSNIQLPKSIPTYADEKHLATYTHAFLKDHFAGILSLQKVLDLAEYVGHPTIVYSHEMTFGKARIPTSKNVKALSTSVDIDDSIEEAILPINLERQNEFKLTTIKFSRKCVEIHQHPACQNSFIRIPKEIACVIYNLESYMFDKKENEGGLLNLELPYMEFIRKQGVVN